MKISLLLALALGCAITAQAQTDPADAAPESQAAASSPAAAAAWGKIDDESQHIAGYLQTRDKASLQALAPRMLKELKAFIAKYPHDSHVSKARMLTPQVGGLERQLGMPEAPSPETISRQFNEIADDASLPQSVRAQAGVMGVNALMESAGAKPSAGFLDDIDQRIDAFQKDFGAVALEGGMPGVFALRQEQVAMLKQAGDTKRLDALLVRLTADPGPDIAAWAKSTQAGEQEVNELRSKPMDLVFTAVDGRKVDLSKLRGKVVLVDFWATWCGPCVAEMPNVIAAYQKYHDQGFEIVGISLDHDQGALEKFVADNHLAWPQYFDGKGWDNAISSRYGIQMIPEMFLLGKDGRLVAENPARDLDAQVAKLLGTK